MNKYIFPTILIALDVGAAIMYGVNGDLKKSNILDCGGSIKRCCNILGGTKMRDILFRAKLKSTDNQKDGTWIFGSAFYRDNGEYWMMIDEDTATDDFGTGSYCIRYETLTEYIGLKDKNGNRIFEGDILKVPNWDCYGNVVYSVPECRFEISMQSGHWVPMHDFASDVEIIGNTYDSPEMLEVRNG